VTVDWPGSATAVTGTVPDWPPASTPTTPPVSTEPDPSGSSRSGEVSSSAYVVQPGDCLWDIAERALSQADQPIDVASVAAAVTAWWQSNSDHIEDPDLIFPGQVLTSPTPRP